MKKKKEVIDIIDIEKFDINRFQEIFGEPKSDKFFLTKEINSFRKNIDKTKSVFSGIEKIFKSFNFLNTEKNNQNILNKSELVNLKSMNSSSILNQNFQDNIRNENNNLTNNTTKVSSSELRKNMVQRSQSSNIQDVKIDMSGMQNTINKENDIESIIRKISSKLEEALVSSAEGVH